MPTDKEVKKWFKLEASKNPQKYYPVKILKEKGFMRKQCKVTGMFFWTLDPNREVCGEPEVNGGFSFIGKPPTKKKFDYLDVWPEFKKFFEKRGYLPMDRYPVVARWRDDVYWVGASIYPFQPYVVRGEIKPPSSAVVIPQPSLRFNDVDNVGVTGSHYTCFDMLGQLHFEKKENYDPDKYFLEYFEWITEGMGIPPSELTLHEDAWAGGGTFGPCMEFFSRGLEVGNQVYMQFQVGEPQHTELDIKVLDMGQGHERVPWIMHGNAMSYETTFPTVIKQLTQKTNFKKDEKTLLKFVPHAALLNADEVENLEQSWKNIAQKIDMDVNDLRSAIEPLTAIYSIAEHTRAALFGINDGALPSNIGGGYNMRIILRRALGFIDRYGWDIDICDLTEEHAKFLKPMYPELIDGIDTVNAVLESEKRKFKTNVEKSQGIISKVIQKEITDEELITLYDSQGISPDVIVAEARKFGKHIKVPADFYAKVAQKHENKEQKAATKKDIAIRTKGRTEILYFANYLELEFDARIVHVGKMPPTPSPNPNAPLIESNYWFIELDRTAFYPTSGGQVHDTGMITSSDGKNAKVIDVIKKDEAILHIVENIEANASSFKIGEKVRGKIDPARRVQLSQHHSGAHIINAASRKVLGKHINQAGAAKDVDKARLDVTHYETLEDAHLRAIEKEANAIIASRLPITYEILPRETAEAKHGMRIYQGGFIPGRNLRIVSVGEIDSQACGGTHVKHTGELETLKILGSTRIQDGVIRINFVAGNAAKQAGSSDEEKVAEVAKMLHITADKIPARAEEVFAVWKKVGKITKSGQQVTAADIMMTSTESYSGDILKEAARRLKTQPEHVAKTLKRFLDEIEQMKHK